MGVYFISIWCISVQFDLMKTPILMKYFPAYCRMFLITFGIGFGGLGLCGIVAIAVIHLFGLESRITQVCLLLLIVPALIVFLLGLGFGNHSFYEACDRIREGETEGASAGMNRERNPDQRDSRIDSG